MTKREELIEKLKKHTIKTVEELHDWCVYYTDGKYKILYNRLGVYIFFGKHKQITLEDVKFVPKKPKGFKSDSEDFVKKMMGGKYVNMVTNYNYHVGFRDDNEWSEEELLNPNMYVAIENPK